MYGTWLEWLAKELNDLVKSKWMKLPIKAKSEVCIYWLQAPTHIAFGEDNMRRLKFNLCLENVLKLYKNMRIIKLKEFWNNADETLVKYGSLTERGYDTYWKSFDSTIKFNVTKREQFLAKSLNLKRKNDGCADLLLSHSKTDDMKTFFKRHRNDKFHWHNGAHGEDHQHS